VDQELHHELRPHGVAHHRRDAKALLRAVRAGDAEARARAERALGPRARERFVLADALHVVALEHGLNSWPAFKRELQRRPASGVRAVGRISALPSAAYAGWAARLLADGHRGDPGAVARLRARVPRLADAADEAVVASATRADAEVCLAREYGFRSWAELAEAADRAHLGHYSRLPAASPWKRAETAIRAGDAGALRALIEQHPGLEHEDPGMTLLGAAAQPEAGRVPREVVDALVEAGSELDVPLNLAACFDQAELVGWLLDAGGDPAAVPIWGITPLQTAIYHGSRDAVDVLVARAGLLPAALYTAAAAGDPARLSEWFDASGALRAEAMHVRPNLADVGWPPRPPARDDPADVLAEALALAAQLGCTLVCEALLDRGAHPSRRPLYGIGALHFAAFKQRRETVELLVGRGAPLDDRDDVHGGTPLDWALHAGATDETLLALLGRA